MRAALVECGGVGEQSCTGPCGAGGPPRCQHPPLMKGKYALIFDHTHNYKLPMFDLIHFIISPEKSSIGNNEARGRFFRTELKAAEALLNFYDCI